MIDFQNIFHSGYLVRDIAGEMAALTETLGICWTKPYVYEALDIWTPGEGAHQIRIEVAYSTDGPQHLEIQTGPPGSAYDPERYSGHHIGLWVEDVAAAARPMLAKGWTPFLSARAPADGFGGFAYLQPPREGMMVELVSLAVKPRLERWWAGGDGPF